MTLDLSIIIVSWNVAEHLRRCLATLPEAVGADYAWEAIVVDNASRDHSVELIKNYFADICLIANSANRLYTAAANQGLALARGRHLLLLNPDTIPHPHSLAQLVGYADQHPRAGLLGPRIIDASGADDLRTGRRYPTPLSETLDWLGVTRRFPHNSLLAANLRPRMSRSVTTAVPVLSGACLLLNQSLPLDLRRLDPGFPMYGEDIDLCRRIQEARFETVLAAEAVVTHLGGQSSRQKSTETALQAAVGANRFFQLWYGRNAARRHRLGMAGVAVCKWLAFSLAGLAGLETNPAAQRRLHANLLRWALQSQRQ